MGFAHEAGKGSRIRSSEDKKKFDEGYDRIFGKKGSKTFVDPPSGWQYGFPAVWDKEQYPKLEDLLRAKDYPEKDIEFALQYMRMWKEYE